MRGLAIALIMSFLVLLVPPAEASVIERSFARDAVAPGETVTVTLNVRLTGGETFYLVDEAVPEGWTVAGSETGDFTDPGHVKWAVIQGAADTSYAYQVRAPQAEGRYAFSGQYMFEGMKGEGTTGGQAEMEVAPPGNPNPVNAGTDFGSLLLPIVAILAAVLAAAYYSSRKLRGKAGGKKPGK